MKQNFSIVNALSFDIEDWFHLVGIDAVSSPAKWDALPSIVVKYTRWIIDTLGQANVRATFFVVGWVADRYPELVKLISESGHELALHSYWHRPVNQLTPEELQDDLRRNMDLIEQSSGKKVLGFRAPSFSITPGDEWAFDVLLDLGLKYDSSLFPAPRAHGGYPCQKGPHSFNGAPCGQPILELPMSMLRVGPIKIPFSGGGYLRLLPAAVICFGFNRLNRLGMPVVVYLHPRDFAIDGPRVAMPLHRRFKCYVGLKTTEHKLRMLLQYYRFDTCASVLDLE